MSYEVPTTEPTEGVAGDSLQWDISYSDFPASEGWQLAYSLRGPTDLDIEWGTHVSANGDGFEVRVPASDMELTPGTYTLFGFVTDGTDRHTVYGLGDDEGVFHLHPNPATEVNAKSHDETVLEAIDAALENRITADMVDIMVNGRRVMTIPPNELLKLQTIYRNRVAAARRGGEFGPSYEVVICGP